VTDPHPDDQPRRGPDQEAEALLTAAAKLFSERGPQNVSVRQIGQSAGVDQNLLAHYFGSKDGLVNAVLDRSAAEIRTAVAALEQNGGDLDDLLGDNSAIDRHARVVAHLVLDWRDPASLQSEFPASELMVSRVQRLTGLDEPAARRRVAQVLALILGWRLYAPFLSAAMGPGVVVDGDSSILAEAVVILMARPPDL
jgi:AcrR family transcriptional regulator